MLSDDVRPVLARADPDELQFDENSKNNISTAKRPGSKLGAQQERKRVLVTLERRDRRPCRCRRIDFEPSKINDDTIRASRRCKGPRDARTRRNACDPHQDLGPS